MSSYAESFAVQNVRRLICITISVLMLLMIAGLTGSVYASMALDIDGDGRSETVSFEDGCVVLRNTSGKIMLLQETERDLSPGNRTTTGNRDEVRWQLWKWGPIQSLVIHHAMGGNAYYEDVFVLYQGPNARPVLSKISESDKRGELKDLNDDGKPELVIYATEIIAPDKLPDGRLESAFGIGINQSGLSMAEQVRVPYVFTFATTAGTLSVRPWKCGELCKSAGIYSEWISGLVFLINKLPSSNERKRARNLLRAMVSQSISRPEGYLYNRVVEVSSSGTKSAKFPLDKGFKIAVTVVSLDPFNAIDFFVLDELNYFKRKSNSKHTAVSEANNVREIKEWIYINKQGTYYFVVESDAFLSSTDVAIVIRKLERDPE
ncbi:hypothetical protein E3J62_09545 [candidate division TA06 bacterium]|uniref:Uncharacterized protein n=1 Tax=candidate division TA06 bacterium TaxID=2250710 RepID=A0A523UQA9_UNCT6|nr:MAG: hypothetical protein E3J62_09545 [candidate division TA06 bacterium]